MSTPVYRKLFLDTLGSSRIPTLVFINPLLPLRPLATRSSSGSTRPLSRSRTQELGGRTARSLNPHARKPSKSRAGPLSAARLRRGGGKEAGKPRATPPLGAHPLPAPLPLHCVSGPQAAAVRGTPQAPSALQPEGCPRQGRHTIPGEPAPRRQSTGEGANATDLRGCCGRAASAGDTDRWAHGGVALGRPPLLRLRWRQYLLSPPTSLPPTPPPSPPPPPPNHRSTEGETQSHNNMAATATSPPLPPAHRARAKHSGRKGGRSPRCGSSLWLRTLLPRSARRPARTLRVRTLSTLARFGRPFGLRSPALTLRACSRL